MQRSVVATVKPASPGDKPRPVVFRDSTGAVALGLFVEHVVKFDDILLVAGWKIGPANVAFVGDNNEIIKPASIEYWTRADLSEGYGVARTVSSGFIAIFPKGSRDPIAIAMPSGEDGGPLIMALDVLRVKREQLETKLQIFWDHYGFILNSVSVSTGWVKVLLKLIEASAIDHKFARGFVEQAKGIPSVGGIVVGWAIGVPSAQLYLASEDGTIQSLQGAIRWNRQDIVDALGNDFGSFAFNAGFLFGWHSSLRPGANVWLVCVEGHQAFILGTAQWGSAPVEAISFAKWAFNLPTPDDKLTTRIECHDGPIIHQLITRRIADQAGLPTEEHPFGPQPEKPNCSIIIPIYGRFDFVYDQLLEFAEDDELRRNSELIYVIDDLRVVTPLLTQAHVLFEAYGVPFKIVWGNANRGFAGAVNLGVSVSRGDTLLIMHSDLVPVRPGWLGTMHRALKPSVGVVGARLLFPNGAIQHEGVEFQWSTAWKSYVKKHTRSGMIPSPTTPDSVVDCQAVTSACMLVHRNIYKAVGGLDEAFLIGDYEDADFCFKVREKGLSVVCAQDIAIVHLERQSIGSVGADEFMKRVKRYNAWRHHKTWESQMKQLIETKAP